MNTYTRIYLYFGVQMHVVVENYEQTHTTVCVKTQDDAGIYDPCWVFTVHAGIYGAPFVSKLKIVLVFTSHVGIYGA